MLIEALSVVDSLGVKPRQLHQLSSLPGPSQSKNIAYRAGRGLAVIAAIRICHGFRHQALSSTQAAEDRLPLRRGLPADMNGFIVPP
jgi:hypothetical protein